MKKKWHYTYVHKIPRIADSATTHTILQCQKYFTILRSQEYFINLTLVKANVNTVSGLRDHIKGFRRATILLPDGIKLCINDT